MTSLLATTASYTGTKTQRRDDEVLFLRASTELEPFHSPIFILIAGKIIGKLLFILGVLGILGKGCVQTF